MSMGASGCKYTNKDAYCPHFDRGLFGCRCSKYNKDLQIHARQKEPIRLEVCADDAGMEAWAIIMKDRR